MCPWSAFKEPIIEVWSSDFLIALLSKRMYNSVVSNYHNALQA
jgi:hypothetical protein